MAAFMEVLDTSIANVALPHMAGNLGASQDQSTWVLTSYLVSNAIVLPITGWLTSVIGRKRFFSSASPYSLFLLCFAGSPQVSGFCSWRASFRALGAVACNRWPRQFWPTSFLRKNVAWRFLSTQSQRYARPPSARHWVDGSPIITLGAGS